jgi:ribulose-phosphate 3-epimerase
MNSQAQNAAQALRQSGPHISVGLLTADLSKLGSEVALMEEVGVPIVHVDVMDGRFCPGMTFGPPFIKAIKTSMLKEVHLMIEDPIDQLPSFVAAGADIITVHVESTRHIHRALQMLETAQNANDPERKIIRGVALNPGTPIEVVGPLLDQLEYLFLLAVNPGWGGQRFIPSTADRLMAAHRLIQASGKDVLLGVDGGITRENIARVAAMGPDVIVTGSAVFDGKAPAENARFMLDQVKAARSPVSAG